MFINIQDDVIKINNLKLLNELLIDRTTRTNIIWATDAYSELGAEYSREKEVRVELITGLRSGVIKTRARKALEQQSARTRQHAEVFTPLWVVNKMNDYADEVWFGYPDVFYKNGEPTEKIEFRGKKTWQKYIDSRRLEVTCGEAPYLVSRYDATTGSFLDVKLRIGLLDRKLRVINENIEDEEEWFKWVIIAYQSVYGFDYQGDNVLLARENLLFDFIDNYLYKFNKIPNEDKILEISKIISWNIFQMDGLKYVVPFSCHREKHELVQLSLFPEFDDPEPEMEECPGCKTGDNRKHNGVYAKIKDWKCNKTVKYIDLMKGWF